MQAVLKRTLERSERRGTEGGGGGEGGGEGADPAARRELALLDAKREIEEPQVEVHAVPLAYF